MTDSNAQVVDVDDPGTWPEQFTVWVRYLADQVRATTDKPSELPCCDLQLREHEEETRRLLNGYLLRAYHAARLLPHEAGAIYTKGLRTLGPELVEDRLAQAHQLGYITETDHDTLLADKTLDTNRVNQVCFFLSATSITRDARGLYQLLATWGGEGIYWKHADTGNILGDKLRSLGLPTIIVAQLDLTVPAKLLVFPGIANAFVGAALGLTDVGGDIFYFAPVPPTGIERLVQPGDPGFPQHPDLPQN